MKKITMLACSLLMCCTALMAQKENTNIRTGWTFGALPSVSFDADLGFQYGALTNIYYFGNGETYPEYLHSFYAEASYTTRHYGIFRFSYDSKHLIPNYRFSVDMAYLPDAMSDFYGFNGYFSCYHPEWHDNTSADYRSRAYYKMQRDLFKLNIDLQHSIAGHLYWNAGIGLFNYTVGSVDLAMLNRGKEAADMLPDTATLYDKYVLLGLIHEAEKAGGLHPYLHAGITYDSRDRQQNPHHGIHADAFLTATGAFGEMSSYNNLRFNACWRHYVPIVEDHLTLAYRAGTQLLLAGNSTFYQNTYMNQLYNQRVLYEGLGGGNSLRGIMRNRINADGFAYANVELRLQIARFKIGKELFYVGINPLFDAGMVVQERHIDSQIRDLIADGGTTTNLDGSTVDVASDFNLTANTTALHLSAGCGLKVAMNDNFVLSVDWATPLNPQDNAKASNLYIKVGYMF